MTTYSLDASTHRPAGSDVVIGGSPLRVFRLTAAGTVAFARLAAGEDVTAGTTVDGLVDRLLDAGAIHPHHVASPYGTADVTVVVPAFVLGESALAEIVRGCPGVAAVIAIDDASEPPVHAVDGARVLRLRTNAGPAVARNAGLGAVTTPLVAFVDTDVRLQPGWLDLLLPHFADRQVGLVAPRVASAPGAGPVAGYERGNSPLDLGPEPGRIAPGTRLSYVPAAAIVVRTDALRAIGGFDRRLRLGEDVDAVWRLIEAGWRCRYEPAVVVHHRPRGSWRGLVAQRISYGSSAAPLAKRHRGALGAGPDERVERRGVVPPVDRTPRPRPRRRRRHRRRLGAQASGRAGRHIAAPRRHGSPPRRTSAGRRRPAGVVAAPPRRGSRLAARAADRRARPPYRR